MTRPTVRRVAAVVAVSCLVGRSATAVVLTQSLQTPAATIKNPVVSSRDAMAAVKKAYDVNCAACHGNLGQGAVKAGTSSRSSRSRVAGDWDANGARCSDHARSLRPSKVPRAS
jgi:mono/diheme cytochrome c family protein